MDNIVSNLGWVAWILTIITWFISGTIVYKNRKKMEANKLSDNIKISIRSIEDKALEFWIKNNDSIYQYEFTLAIKRIQDDIRTLSKVDKKFKAPINEFISFRKSITLDIESESRPVSEFSERQRNISLSCYILTDRLPNHS